MEAQIQRLFVVLTIIALLVGGAIGFLSWSRYHYLQQTWVDLSSQHQLEREACERRAGSDCAQIWLAQTDAISGYLDSSYEAQHTLAGSAGIAIGGPAILWILFYLARWIRTGSWRSRKISG